AGAGCRRTARWPSCAGATARTTSKSCSSSWSPDRPGQHEGGRDPPGRGPLRISGRRGPGGLDAPRPAEADLPAAADAAGEAADAADPAGEAADAAADGDHAAGEAATDT